MIDIAVYRVTGEKTSGPFPVGAPPATEPSDCGHGGSPSGALVEVGRIAGENARSSEFRYSDSYLDGACAIPLSLSLPLGRVPYGEPAFQPYFEGLLPEGPARDALAAQLQASRDDYLRLLSSNGIDCIGDVALVATGSMPGRQAGYYEPIDESGFPALFDSFAAMASSNGMSHLSLAGMQGKVGLAHMPDAPLARGWLRSHGMAGSTHILKANGLSRISSFEVICTGAAELCALRLLTASPARRISSAFPGNGDALGKGAFD